MEWVHKPSDGNTTNQKSEPLSNNIKDLLCEGIPGPINTCMLLVGSFDYFSLMGPEKLIDLLKSIQPSQGMLVWKTAICAKFEKHLSSDSLISEDTDPSFMQCAVDKALAQSLADKSSLDSMAMFRKSYYSNAALFMSELFDNVLKELPPMEDLIEISSRLSMIT